jgi:hypothetical protein
MSVSFAIPVRTGRWAPWQIRPWGVGCSVQRREGVSRGLSGRTRRGLLLAIRGTRTVALVRLLRRALLQYTVLTSWSRRPAMSVRLACRTPFANAVATKAGAVAVRLVVADAISHRKEDGPEHSQKFGEPRSVFGDCKETVLEF